MDTIHTEEEYQKALARFEEIRNAPIQSEEGEEAEFLSYFIFEYEKQYLHYDASGMKDWVTNRFIEYALKNPQDFMHKFKESYDKEYKIRNRKKKFLDNSNQK